MTDEDKTALLSKLRAPVAGERELFQRNDTLISFAVSLAEETLGKSVTPKDYVAAGVFVEKERQARAALASAPADPEAAEVDFLVRVLENLDTWRAEEWSELLERRPAILAMLRPMVLASAPVAGDAQPVATLHDDGYYTWHGAKPQGYEQAGWRMKVYAAPQASEAVRDAAFSAGVKAAADLVKKMVDDYDADLGSTDPETGTREYPGEGATWVCEMQELEESIRALSAQPGAQRTGGSDA